LTRANDIIGGSFLKFFRFKKNIGATVFTESWDIIMSPFKESKGLEFDQSYTKKISTRQHL
jgi:hypothetical protein